MRQIGLVPLPGNAQRFCDHLLTLGIRSRSEPTPEGCAIWIIDEGDVVRSRAELAEFLEQPNADRYGGATKSAEAIRRDAAAREKQYHKNVVEMRSRWDRPLAAYPRFTLLVAGIAVAVGLMTQLGENFASMAYFRISNFVAHSDDEPFREAGDSMFAKPYIRYAYELPLWGLSEVKRGQVWRLLTPIFLHFGFPHLLFNLMMWTSFASLIERRYGWLPLLGFVMISGVLSNLAQYAHTGPVFGGLSGVDYGLFGFIWIKGKFDPTFGARLTPMSVFMALLWFFICMTGRVGPIANAAHAVGLLTGIMIAFATLPRR